ncbi:MAG TPA: response regulator [Candidatus Solibacter sp.]|nr:response regulator [Candidatus Solibacter sp.]
MIEDNLPDAVLVREALEEHGVEGELLVIGDGAAAIAYVETAKDRLPDLVILDLNLPKRSGREVLQAIRQAAAFRDTAVVVLSSSGAHQDRADTLAAGARQYIRKPLRLEEFLDLGAVFRQLLESA